MFSKLIYAVLVCCENQQKAFFSDHSYIIIYIVIVQTNILLKISIYGLIYIRLVVGYMI
jgi:hypothetical protein